MTSPMLDTLAQDARYGFRALVKNKAFTLVSVATLALAIGVNTAIFSVVHAVMLTPLPFDHSERIVTIWEDFTAQGGPAQEWIEVPNFFAWRAETDVFETLAAYGFGPANLTRGGQAEQVSIGNVSREFLPTFGVAPAIGRAFAETDDRPGDEPVALLSNGFWLRALGGDASVVGEVLQLSGVGTRVVGVLPAGFEIPNFPAVDIWRPLRIDANSSGRGNFFLQGLGRLKAGVSVEQATAELDAVMARIGAEFPSDRGVTINIVPLLEQIVSPVKVALWVLLGIVGFVMLMACANIANLMLSRGATRHREMALRAAIGADRRRIVRQLLTESLVLSSLGALVGVLFAYWGIQALVAMAPAGAVPRLEAVRLHAAVLLFTMAVTVVAGLTFGLVPALQSSRLDLNDALREGGRGSQDTGLSACMRGGLVGAQVAIALCLLVASGLTIRSIQALLSVDPGFDGANLTTASISIPGSSAAGQPELVTFLDTFMERTAARPAVESVAAVSVLPLSGIDSDTSFEIEGRPTAAEPGDQPVAWYRRVTPLYFRTMGVPVLRGRAFSDGDRAQAESVVMVSDVTARQFWPNEDALGQRVRFGDGPWHTIVGIAQGVRHAGLGQSPRPELYFPFAQRPGRGMTVVVKSAGEQSAIADALRADLRELAPDVPLSGVVSMASLMDQSVAQQRFFMSLTTGFGFLALALAAVGIYGVMSYTVSRRTAEMGLRMALGAGRGDVIGMVLGHGFKLIGLGMLAGLIAAYWAASLLRSVLFEVDPRDPVTLLGVSAVLAVIGFLACLPPAIRATRIDPIQALRDE